MAVRRTSSTLLYTNASGVIPYKFRQIITRGYVAGGYKSATPWRNVNWVNTSSDTTTSLGDLLQTTHVYTSGASSPTVGFIWSGAGFDTASSYTSVFSMANNTTYAQNSLMNTPENIGDAGTVQQDNDQAWIFNASGAFGGASNNVIRYNLLTETRGTSFGGIAGSSLGKSAGWNETHGFVHGTNTDVYFTFATETQVSGPDYANSGQQKTQNSKDDRSWAGNEGTYNGGNNFRRTFHATNTVSGTVGKPITNSGEENINMGQDWGYMLGMYDGAQNNRAWKWTYATETGFEGGSAMQPKGGQGGRSSGHGFHWG